MELIKYLKDKAPSNICQPGTVGLSNAKYVSDLLQMFVDNIDYCLSENYPSQSDLLEFGGEELKAFGIYIEQKTSLNDKEFLVLFDCSANLTYNHYGVGTIFIKGNSNITLTANRNCCIVVDIFDNSQLSIQAEQGARVLVNVYGNAKVEKSGTGHINIIHKNKPTY